jgi:phosphoglucomutase
MTLHALAGQPAPANLLIDVSRLERAYYENRPDAGDPDQAVSFGTSGHRGSPFTTSFNEAHVLAITQAICDYRAGHGISGPLYLGKDTHAVSGPAERTALEVLAANGMDTFIQRDDGVTPTPVISHAILTHNRGHARPGADGIVITPSHNPPADGGFKYNPPHGGPAHAEATGWIQDRANALLHAGNRNVRRIPIERARNSATIRCTDFIVPYVRDLATAVDLECIRAEGLRIGIDPMGGAAAGYWPSLQEQHGLDITVVNATVDPTFRFMPLDHDGQIRMDCSSAHAMAGLVGLKDRFDIAFGNDPDADRHGIVCRGAGLMNPNHYLAAAIHYLLGHRPAWPAGAGVGKTLVSSGLIDRVVRAGGRTLVEVPVGFKWFAPGLLDASLCFGGEESAGASFLRRDGTVWTTDKDGLLLGLLAAEMTARMGKDPAACYGELASRYGTPYYVRIDAPASPEQKRRLSRLAPDAVTATKLAGETILARHTRAPGNDAPIGGLKVATENGWFAARPSGTENIYKLYAESFTSQLHLESIVDEAQRIVSRSLNAGA